MARIGLQIDQSSVNKANAAIEGLKSGLLKMAAIGSAALYGLKALTEETATNAREVLRAAQITGMSTDALQGLNYAAKQSGVSAEELQHGLVHLARSAREATMGGGGAGLAFQQMGVKVTDGAGKLRSLDGIFTDVAARLQKMPDGTNKAALSMSLFGRAGAQLIPLLDQGPEGLARFTEEAKKLGVVMSGEQLAAANRYKITLDRMAASVTSLKNAISLALFPAMSRGAEQLMRWISAHRQWVALNVAAAFERVSQVLKGVAALFERIWNSGTAGKAVLISLAAAVTLLTAPWLALIAVLAVLAEDVEAYFEGRGSVLGLMIGAFTELKKRTEGLSIKQVFVEALVAAKELFTYLEQSLARKMGGNGSGNTVVDKDSIWEQIQDYFRSNFHRTGNAVREGRGQAPLDDQDDPANVFGARPAFTPKGSAWSRAIGEKDWYLVDEKTRAGTGVGSGLAPINFKLDLTVHANSDAEGRAAGKAAGDALVTHEDLNRMLREAAASSGGASVP